MTEILKIGVTQGDTNGIGWELILKIFSDSRMCEICTPIIYGSKSVAEHYKKTIAELDNISFNVVASAGEARKGRVNLVECGAVGSVTPGKAAAEAGKAAIEALAKAAEELKSGALDAVVTAPFNKESVQSSDFTHTGHTEFMASQFEGESMMMMCSEIFKVGLVTKHVPLNKVAEMISTEMIVKDLQGLRKTLITDFSIREPRIAVMSLNPHAGEGGMLGGEEQEIIQPAIQEAYKGGVFAFGPFPADGFFAAASYKKYDAVLAIYHDQGLIPFKTLSPEGVNFTAGLTAVRTSPDHGVAYDIAGKDVANTDSMRNAIYMAIDVVNSRKIYAEISKDPLQHIDTERERGDHRGGYRENQHRNYEGSNRREGNTRREPRDNTRDNNRTPREPRPQYPQQQPKASESPATEIQTSSEQQQQQQ
ncbi:MAG: 4-hydroxythreonine-4-phosphate dehydrogenase PdxA [Rikenellaceae bacterium]